MPAPTLPPGYTWGVCNPDEAKFITDHWQHSPENEAENTREKLKLLPSVCIYYEGKQVAFEMINIGGSLNHQFVLKEHRGKGLGAAIEIEISKKCIKEGIVVHKNVDVDKTSINEASMKCPYWTTIKNPDGSDCFKEYLLMKAKE